MSKEKRPKIYFLLSVDTEEEFDWAGDFPQQHCSVENIQQLPEFQTFCDGLGIRPTYLVDYPVAADTNSAAILREIVSQGRAEIGAHLHPWCTPPLTEENGERESHVVNLSPELIVSKLEHLTEIIKTNLDVEPKSFRTGRWGTDAAVMKAVLDAGYDVESSMIPLYENTYFSFLQCLNQPYWPDMANPYLEGQQRDILEIPVSAGFNRSNYLLGRQLHAFLSRAPIKHLRIMGFLDRLKLFRKIYLSPELASAEDMKALAASEIKNQHQMLHMFIHSSSLLPGKNSYTGSALELQNFYSSIKQVVEYLHEHADVVFCTISECKVKLFPRAS